MDLDLVVIRGPDKGARTRLCLGQPCFVGRESNADLRISDELVSEDHLVVVFDGDNITVLDKHSLNGTFVGNHQIPSDRKIKLSADDRVSIGPRTMLGFVVASKPAKKARGGSSRGGEKARQDGANSNDAPKPSGLQLRLTTSQQREGSPNRTHPVNYHAAIFQVQSINNPVFENLILSTMTIYLRP